MVLIRGIPSKHDHNRIKSKFWSCHAQVTVTKFKRKNHWNYINGQIPGQVTYCEHRWPGRISEKTTRNLSIFIKKNKFNFITLHTERTDKLKCHNTVSLIQNVQNEKKFLAFFFNFILEQIVAIIFIRISHSRKVHSSHNLDFRVHVQNRLDQDFE